MYVIYVDKANNIIKPLNKSIAGLEVIFKETWRIVAIYVCFLKKTTCKFICFIGLLLCLPLYDEVFS